MDYKIFILHTEVNACDCTWGCMDIERESALKVDWEENPLPHRGIKPASAMWQSDALTAQPQFCRIAEPLWVDPDLKIEICACKVISTEEKKRKSVEWIIKPSPKYLRATKKPPLPSLKKQLLHLHPQFNKYLFMPISVLIQSLTFISVKVNLNWGKNVS